MTDVDMLPFQMISNLFSWYETERKFISTNRDCVYSTLFFSSVNL